MLNNALIFLLQALFSLLTLAFLLRFYFQMTKVSFQQPAAQVIITLTNFAVKPLRRIVPSFKKLDLSTLLLAYLTQFLLNICVILLKGFPLLIAGETIWLTILAVALIGIVSLSITIFMYAVLIQAILSWVNPYTPVAPLLNNLTHPILSFLRRFIPLAGNIDLSPLIFIITAQMILSTILMPLETNLLLMK
jgi:YggT family protein